MKQKYLIFIGLMMFCYSAKANKIDSLRNELKKSTNDTASINILNDLILESRKINREQALNYSDIALKLAAKTGFRKGEATSYLMLGSVYYDNGNFKTALECYFKSLTIRKELDDKRGTIQSLNNIGDAQINLGQYLNAIEAYQNAVEICNQTGEKLLLKYNNIAAAYYLMGNYEKATDYYTMALKQFEVLGFKEKMINPYLGIGGINKVLGKYEKALEYYQKALQISQTVQNLGGRSKALTGLATIYEKLNKNDSALIFYQEALQIAEDLKDKSSIALSLMNVGNVFVHLKKYDSAIEFYEKALKTNKLIDNKNGISESMTNMGVLFSEKGDMDRAILYLKESLEIARFIKSKDVMMEDNEELSEAYFKKGDFKNAYNFYREYIAIKDSLLSETNTKNITEINTKYETEKKESEIELLTKDNDIQNEKIKNQENVRNGLIVGCFLLLLIIFLAYNRYRVKQRASKEIAEKNKEITESISYAKRIQTSFLTSEKYIAQRLSDYFILYKPRNIVSGDFYWFMEKENNFYICTADCTGHGIPGAFMSLICMGILNEIIYSKNHIKHTDDMLNELRRIIILAVNPEGATEEGKDGMDAVLCRFDFQKMEVEYSAANNSFYIIRNGELFVHKPDKMPVGKHYGLEKPFTRTTIPIQKGDCIYSFSDGFADQFGGPEDKKFQTKQLKELLLSHCHKPMKIQQRIFNDTIEAWKGNLEQVDDILLIGIRV